MRKTVCSRWLAAFPALAAGTSCSGEKGETPTGRGASECAITLLFALALTFTAGCSPNPGTVTAKEAITAHFEQKGYLVRDISIGAITRNPVAERVYMAPLTYVVEVPSIVLEPRAPAGDLQETKETEGLHFSGASVKIQALSPPRQGWRVSQIDGIEIP